MNPLLSVALVVCVATASSTAAHLPDTITTCKRSESNFNECLVGAIQGAIPALINGKKSLGVPKLDPLHVSSIHIPGNGGRVDLEQTFTDLYFSGLTSMTVTKVTADLDGGNCKLKIEGIVPSLVMDSDLKLVGKMLLFTINGGGKSKITNFNIKAVMDMTCERVEKEGKMHLHFTELKLDLNPEKLTFEIGNLVDGNEQLSAEVLKVMNENDLDIFKELKSDYQTSFSKVLFQITNELFSRVPEDEVFPK